jgi:hypothetical protein
MSEQSAVAHESTAATESKFPKYLMNIDGKRRFMPMREAGTNYDSSWSSVEICGLVLEEDFSVRDIIPEERSRISFIADRCSAEK